jgi:anti-sigma B factor antagonist
MHFVTDVIHNGVAVIRGNGRLNMLAAASLRRTISSAMSTGASKLVLDLSGVDYLDTTSLGSIVAGMKAARAAGGDLRITVPGPQPALVLEMSRVNRVLLSSTDPQSAFSV